MFICGENGHQIIGCKQKKNHVERNSQFASRLGIPKDLLRAQLKDKGPKFIWLPKTKT